MTKLTTWMRESLVKDLLKHRFGLAAQTFLAEKAAFALEVYADLYSKKERASMEALPAGWLPVESAIGVQFGDGRNYTKLSFNGATYGLIAAVSPESLERVDFRVQSQHETGCAKVYEATHPLSLKFDELKGRQRDLEKQIETAKSQAEAAVASASTIGKLVSIWPEIEPFTLKHVFRRKPVPALPTKDLNALLDLPVSEAA